MVEKAMNRRDFVKAACATSLTAFAGCRDAEARRFRTFVQGWDGNVRIPVPGLADPVRFLVVGDTHFAFHDARDDAYRGNYARMSRHSGSKDAFEKLLAKAKAEKVDLVCLVGDTISFPSLANVEYVERTLRASGVRWLYTAGNHDWHFEGLPGSDAAQRDEWIEKRLKPLYQGANPLASSVVVKGVRFVAIDNSIYHVGEEQLAFWKAEAAKGDPIVLLMHVPLWVEGLDVFTCGCPTWGTATDPYWEIERRERWASSQSPSTFAFRDAVLATPNLVGVFAGHVHRPSAVHTPEDQLLFTVPSNREGAAFDICLLPYALH